MRNELTLLICLASCSPSLPPEETACAEAMAAAQQGYGLLLEERYDEFLSSRADMTNLPDSYREQMVDAYRMYIDTERRTHRGISSAVATRAEMDSTLSLMQVFVMLTFADSTQEEVVVPMVRRDGQWKMR